jgi:hypothetical protein
MSVGSPAGGAAGGALRQPTVSGQFRVCSTAWEKCARIFYLLPTHFLEVNSIIKFEIVSSFLTFFWFRSLCGSLFQAYR